MLRNAPKLERSIPLTDEEIEIVKVYIKDHSNINYRSTIAAQSNPVVKKFHENFGIHKIKSSPSALKGIRNVTILPKEESLEVKSTILRK